MKMWEGRKEKKTEIFVTHPAQNFGSPLSVSFHSTKAPYSFSSTCYSYQKDKWATPVNLQKAILFRNWEAIDRKVYPLFAGFTGLITTPSFIKFHSFT
jgi:hypothetical protein